MADMIDRVAKMNTDPRPALMSGALKGMPGWPDNNKDRLRMAEELLRVDPEHFYGLMSCLDRFWFLVPDDASR